MNRIKKRISKLILLILGICLLLSPTFAFAQTDTELPNPSKEFYVYDEANMITQNTSDHIIRTNEQLYEETGTQIVVAVVNTIGERSIEEYANQLYRKWKIGSAKENNGVLFLIALDQKQMRLEVGYGLEGALPDGKVGQIRDDYIIPSFQQGKYNEGILEGFNEIVSLVGQEYEQQSLDNSQSGQEMPTDEKSNWSELIKKGLIILGILLFLVIDFTFFGGMLTYAILRMVTRGGFRGNDNNKGGGGSSGGGGASGNW